MKKLLRLKKGLGKLNGNLFIGCSPGYDSFFEEFLENVWRINIIGDMDSLSLSDFIHIKNLVADIFEDYNLIIATQRDQAMEHWFGSFKRDKKNLLLFLTPFSSRMIGKDLFWMPFLIKKELISGEIFSREIEFQKYDWKDFLDIVNKSYIVNYIYLKNDIIQEFKLGMLKAYILRVIASAIYCKGRIPKNRKLIKKFFEEKFSDKKIQSILDDLYDNNY